MHLRGIGVRYRLPRLECVSDSGVWQTVVNKGGSRTEGNADKALRSGRKSRCWVCTRQLMMALQESTADAVTAAHDGIPGHHLRTS